MAGRKVEVWLTAVYGTCMLSGIAYLYAVNHPLIEPADLYLLIIPLAIANILHMLIVKLDLFSSLVIPINERLFGPNKTLRGFIVLTLFNALLVWLFGHLFTQHSPLYLLALGAVYGFTYMVSELPNSWFKRRQGIEAGQLPLRNKWFYALLNKSDSCLGVCIVFYFIEHPGFSRLFIIFIFSICLHIMMSALLYFTRLKKSF